ncbi:hypothetical protein QLX08_002189 [Tetragonisca angustula]|uniref:Uncharacterized protein n=2 Tax=Tetragonisca angustula TaxID=166442 RepID=A0AAW1AEU2_9HYME
MHTLSPKKRSVLEYLDLCTDPPPPVPSHASCYTRMHSYTQSACDCYCRTRVPIARRREEVHCERSRVRGSRSSVLKMETARSAAKRVPLIAAKVVDDEQVLQLDSKRSTATVPVSPVLSPETTATLENAEKLIKQAEIQMKEISMNASRGRFQSCINVRPDEATLDDENDQLLYVRERVACKFQEANGWIDTDTGNSRRFANEEREAIEPTSKRLVVDLSAPRFQTSADRYEKFSRQRRLDIRELGLATSHSVDEPENNERARKIDDGVRSPRDERMDVFSVQIGPSVNIKGDLVAQKLGNIHISPDPSFAWENQNTGTFVVRRDSSKGNEGKSSGRREKIARIVEEDEDAVKLKKPDGGSTVLTNIEEPDNHVENVCEADKSLAKNCENERDRDESTNLEEPKVAREEQEVKLTFKSEQKQVRFEERCSEKEEVTECRKSRLEMEEDAARISEEKNLGTRVANDKTERREYSVKRFEAGDEQVPLSSREIAEKHKANRKRHREIREDRRRGMDERFANIVRACRERGDERSKSRDEDNVSSSSTISADSSEESLPDSLNFRFYEPSINELDDVLVSYDEIIGNIVQSTRTIDKFLSRPELREYCADDGGRGKSSSNGGRIEETERKSDGCLSIDLKKRRSQSSTNKLKKVGPAGGRRSVSLYRDSIDDLLLVASGSLKEMKRVEAAASPSSLASCEDDLAKRRGEPAIKARDIKMKDRLDRPDRLASSENSETTGKRTFPRKARLFRIVNDSSSLTASSVCPLTSSTATNNTRLSDEASRLSNNDELVEKGTISKINPTETKIDPQNVPLDVSKGIVKGKLENFIARLAAWDDRATKNALSVNEIVVPVVIKSLLERLENDEAYPEDLGSPIPERYSPASNNVFERRDSQLEPPSSSAEGRRDGGEPTSDKSVLKCSEITSRDEEADEMGCSVEGSSKTGSRVDGTRSNLERGDENSVDSRTNENLISTRTESNVADESTAGEPSRATGTLEDDLLHDVGKEETNLMKNAGDESEESLKRDNSEASKENLAAAGEKVGNFVESRSIENTGNDDGFVKKIAQDSSDSLRDCASLRSSLRNLSRSSSSSNNNAKPSRELKRTERCNAADDEIENMNNPRFDSVLEREKILSDVYDDMNKKLFSSTCLDANTNCSSFLNQQRFSNGISAISTIRSNKVEISSDTSHSEGELYMPSSGSYSLGEVRMLTKSRSDSENADNLDSNVAIFVTKEMLTSWSESSKSLVQSMGEI